MTAEQRNEEYRRKLRVLQEEQETTQRELQRARHQNQEFDSLKQDINRFFPDMKEWATGQNSRKFSWIREEAQETARTEARRLLEKEQYLEQQKRALQQKEMDYNYEHKRQMRDAEV